MKNFIVSNKSFGRRIIASFVLLAFLLNSGIAPIHYAYGQSAFISTLPAPGTMVGQSSAFVPVLVKGLVVHFDRPLNFDLIVDSGNDSSDQAVIKEQSQRMAQYFLAAITVPEEQLWVNLSPYEKDRIIENELGQTVLGRDMLAQDYILKQLTSSLIYPEKGLGKEFWARVYAEAQAKFGTTDIPVDTFNKIWIMPEKAEVYEKGNAVYVTEATLKVMLDSDRTAMSQSASDAMTDEKAVLAKAVMREIVLPGIEKEVNEGKNFAAIRQVYHAAILAKWYRELIQKTLLADIYVGKNKVAGVTADDKTLKEEIYQRYIAAYKKGVFNYIKEEVTTTGETLPRKYFSGGENLKIDKLDRAMSPEKIGRVGKIFRIDMAMSAHGDASMRGDSRVNKLNAVEKADRATRIEEAESQLLTSVAITGGTGDIGHSFVKALRHNGGQVQMLVRPGSEAKAVSLLGDQGDGLEFINGRLFDSKALHDLVRSTNVVYHFAAVLAQEAGAPQADVFAVNAVSTALLVSAVKDVDLQKRVIYASSQRVLGIQGRKDVESFLQDAYLKINRWIQTLDGSTANQVEAKAIELSNNLIAMLPKDVNVYDVSKFLGEMFISELPHHVIARISNAYGPDYPNPRLINRLFDAVSAGREISVANETRDFIYQEDLNQILIALAKESHTPDEMDLASGTLTSMERIKEVIADIIPAASELIKVQGEVKQSPRQDGAYGEKLLGRRFTDIEVGLKNVRAARDKARESIVDDARNNVIDLAKMSFETQDDIVEAKQKISRAVVKEKGIGVFKLQDMVDLINDLGARNIPLGLGSGNTNSVGILTELDVLPFFGAAIVDGNDVREGRVPGKPNKDFYIAVARKMGKDPKDLVVIEDAVPGIRTAVAGGFGLVIGLAREPVDPGDRERLKEAGADVVFEGNNTGLTAERINEEFNAVNGRDLEGVVFDLDGVILDTEPVHFDAWKKTFDAYFRLREAKYGEPFREFTLAEYKNIASGKPSPGVVKTILEARGIDLLTRADFAMNEKARIEEVVIEMVHKGYDEEYVRLLVDKYVKSKKAGEVLDLTKVESELSRLEEVVDLLVSKGMANKDRVRLFVYKQIRGMKHEDVVSRVDAGWIGVVERELTNVQGLVKDMLSKDPTRNENHVWRIIDQHIKRLIQREKIDLDKEKSRAKWLGRLEIAFEYWEQKRRIYNYRLVNHFGSPATEEKGRNIRKVTDEFIEIMQREFKEHGVNFFLYSGGSGAGNSSMWDDLFSRGAVAEQYKKFIMYNSRDRRPDEDDEFSKDLDLNDLAKVEQNLKDLLNAIVDNQIPDGEGNPINIEAIDIRNIDRFKADIKRWQDKNGKTLTAKGQATLTKILALDTLADHGKRSELDEFTDVYRESFRQDYLADEKMESLEPPYIHKKISSTQLEISLAERLGRLRKDGWLRVYKEFDGFHYFWLPKGYLAELDVSGDVRTLVFNKTDVQGISFKAIKRIIDAPVKNTIYVLETIPEFLEKIQEDKELNKGVVSIIVSVVETVAVIGTGSSVGKKMLQQFGKDGNVSVIGTEGVDDTSDPVDVNNIETVEAYLKKHHPDELFFAEGLPAGDAGFAIRNLCLDLNVKIADIPPVLIEHGYTIIDAPTRGGSSSQTFIARDKDGRAVVIKYSDWDGISGNGLPWLQQQKNKLKYIQRKFPLQARSLYPKVLDYWGDDHQFYYVMECFEGSEDITQYFFYDPQLTAQQMYEQVDGLIAILVNTHYLPQGLPLPAFEGEVESNLFNRAKYRLGLLRRHDGPEYDRLIKGKPFKVGALEYKDSSWFFEDLFNSRTLRINGKEYYNLPILLNIVAEKIREIQASLGPAHFSHYVHSDIPLRNALRLPDGSIRLIDVRGVNVHPTSPSRVSVEYDIGKIAHSFFMEIVRNEKYNLEQAEKDAGGFAFKWAYKNDPGVHRYLEVWKDFRSLLEKNAELNELFKSEGSQRWIDYVSLLETFNYLSDAIHRFSQDPTGKDPLMYYLQGTIGLNDFLDREGFMPSTAELAKVDVGKAVDILETPGLVSPPLSIVRNQLEIIERGLGHEGPAVQENVQAVLKALEGVSLRGKVFKLAGEEVDVLDGVGADAKVIGQIDRNIADGFGYFHETVNAVVVSPDKTKVILTRRAHNKEPYPRALTIPGGHLMAGQSARDGIFAELEEELELPFLAGKLQEAAVYSYGVDQPVSDNMTKERRVLYVYQLTPSEYEQVLARMNELDDAKGKGEEAFKKEIETRQFEGAGEVWSYHPVVMDKLFSLEGSFKAEELLPEENGPIEFTPDLLTHLIHSPDLTTKMRKVIDDMPVGTRAGMAFIMGTGNNGSVINEQGEVYTDGGALLELGFNILFRKSLGRWVFTGKTTHGQRPQKEPGDSDFIDHFSGINIARSFIDQVEGREDAFAGNIKVYPDGMQSFSDLVRALRFPDSVDEESRRMRALAADVVLKAVTEAFRHGDFLARRFVEDTGREMGAAFAPLLEAYIDEPWVEKFVMVSGVGENFARIQGQTTDEDVFVLAVRDGVRTSLQQDARDGGLSSDANARIFRILGGICRSNISWDREILAARLTTAEIDKIARDGRVDPSTLRSIGVSLGGTKIGVSVIDTSGRIVSSVEVKWREKYRDTPEDILGGIFSQMKTVLKGTDMRSVRKIGISFAGPVDRERGIVGAPFAAPNLPFENYPLRERLQEKFQGWVHETTGQKENIIVDVYNDALAAVLGEALSPSGLFSIDAAISGPVRNGGIDIQNIHVDSKTGGIRIQFNDQAVRDVIKNGFDGFTPVIVNITPVQSPLMILGVSEMGEPVLSQMATSSLSAT